MSVRKNILLVGATIGALTVSVAAVASNYPERAINIIVPFGPGGTDSIARLVGQVMSEDLGQPVVVNNKPGASGTIGTAYVANRVEADGYTLLLGSPGSVTASGPLFPDLPYSGIDDLEPIGQIVSVPNFLVVSSALDINNVQGLLDYVEEQGDGVSYGTSGVGTSQHLAAELLANMVGLDMVHIPYKGSAAALADIVGGVLDIAFVDPTAVPMIEDGRVSLVGITTPERLKALPDFPTLSEVGAEEYSAGNWYGLFAPKGTDKEIVQQLNQSLRVALESDEVKEKIFAMGMDPIVTTTAEFQDFLIEDASRWAEVVDVAEIKIE